MWTGVGDVRKRARTFWNDVIEVVFDDNLGVAIFLGALVFFFIRWRIGILVTDNYTIANTMAAVADGHLAVDRILFGQEFGPARGAQPGMKVVDGRLYGRNYGHVFLSLPFLWLVEAGSVVADLRILLASVWSLVILGLAVQVGRLVGQRREFALLGSLAALGMYAANLTVATPIDPRWHPVIALQLSTMIAAALIGVFLYRLIALLHDRPTGAFIGIVVVLATPVGFWASLPKRHAVTALLATVALYGFAVSRHNRSQRTILTHRALAYAAVGLTAWIHAAEALVLFAVLVPLDLLTARSNDRQELLILGGAFVASLIPFLLTNTLIAGNPLEPPRLWPQYTGETDILLGSDAATDRTLESTDPDRVAQNDGSGGSVWVLLLAAIDSFSGAGERFAGYTTTGLRSVISDPSRLMQTFIRSGYIPNHADEPAMNLTVLETMPIAGVILALPIVTARRLISGTTVRPDLTSPRRQADVFAISYSLLLVLLFISRLPLHAQFTVRYLLPVVPMLAYGIGRLRPVRKVVTTGGTLLTWSYALLVVIATQLAIVILILTDFSFGEIMQLHALAGLSAAGIAAAWLTTEKALGPMDTRVGAVALALAMAVMTVFLLLSGWKYFPYGDLALPVVRLINDATVVR